MNYYSHNIGDYAQATMHLSLIEDAIYSRLLRRYYAEETPIVNDLQQVSRWVGARSEEEREAVAVILNEFFELRDDYWHNKRADEEIAAYKAKAETARVNGSKGGRPKSEPKPRQSGNNNNPEKTDEKPNDNPQETNPVNSANPEETGLKANQEPITNNQEPIEETTYKPEEGCARDDSSSAPENPQIPENSENPTPDEAPTRPAQIAVLIRRNGACHRTHAGDKGVIELANLNATDTEILSALETAKRQRKDTGSSQPITASYLVPIVKEQRAVKPASSGKYDKDLADMAAMNAWADAQILAEAQAAQHPATPALEGK